MKTALKDQPVTETSYDEYFNGACKQYRKASSLPSRLVQRHIEIASYASLVWFTSLPCEEHEFLTSRNIRSFGLKQYNNLVIAPMHDAAGVIWNYYPIQLDCEAPWSGRLSGCYFHLGQPDAEGPVYICLDYISAASLHMATGQQVAVVFQVENVPSILLELKKRYAPHHIVLAPDLDVSPDQLMQNELSHLAKKHGCQYVIPKLGNSNPSAEIALLKRPLWNWNDVHRIYGLQAVSDLLARKEKAHA